MKHLVPPNCIITLVGSWSVSAHVIPQQQQNIETTAAQSSHFTLLFAREIDFTSKKQFYSSFAISYCLEGTFLEKNIYDSKLCGLNMPPKATVPPTD